MLHLHPAAGGAFLPEPLRSALRGASLLEVRTTAQSCMGLLLEWFHPGLVAVLDLTRASLRSSPAESLAAHDGSFDAVVALGAMRSRRLFDAVEPAALIRAVRPGGYLVMTDFVPHSGEKARLGAQRLDGAPQLLEWVQRFGGFGLSWLRPQAELGDAGRFLVAQLAEAAS